MTLFDIFINTFLLLIFLISILLWWWGFYLIIRMAFRDDKIYVLTVFSQQKNISFISLNNASNNYKYIIIFIINNIISFMLLLFYSYLATLFIDSKFNKFYLVIPFILIFLLSYIYIYFSGKKLIREIKKIGIDSKEDAINKFKTYLLSMNKELKISEYKLYNENVVASRNFAFQLAQSSYKKKIKRLEKKSYSDNKYFIKLLNIYIKYLKRYARMLTYMKNESKWDCYYPIINEKKYDNLEPLKEVLVNNFFAYVQASQAEEGNK